MSTAGNFRVAVSGASSLLGKELLGVLDQRHFPVSQLVTLRSGDEEPEVPIVDLQEIYQDSAETDDVSLSEVDFAFLAARPSSMGGRLPFLRESELAASRCTIIDVAGALPDLTNKVLSIPFLDRDQSLSNLPRSRPTTPSHLFVSAHPATIMISSLLLRLQARFPLKCAVAQVFAPASEAGGSGIEELQRQTINLLSFQKIPNEVFGAQLAFNLLPRLGRAAEAAPASLEARLRNELRHYLSNSVPLPALRVFHVPVFYSLGLSLYVETAEPANADALRQALEGERIHLHRPSQHAPSQVEAAGSSDILVDTIAPDADHSCGLWIWAVADNVCLAAVNAVEIAETVKDNPR